MDTIERPQTNETSLLQELPQRLQGLAKQRPSAGAGRQRPPSASLCSATEFAGRLLRLIGPAARRSPRRRAASDRLFLISSNGVGIGHLTRLLSVAFQSAP